MLMSSSSLIFWSWVIRERHLAVGNHAVALQHAGSASLQLTRPTEGLRSGIAEGSVRASGGSPAKDHCDTRVYLRERPTSADSSVAQQNSESSKASLYCFRAVYASARDSRATAAVSGSVKQQRMWTWDLHCNKTIFNRIIQGIERALTLWRITWWRISTQRFKHIVFPGNPARCSVSLGSGNRAGPWQCLLSEPGAFSLPSPLTSDSCTTDAMSPVSTCQVSQGLS